MRLLVLGSSSKGNCYLLKGTNETLMLEAGVSFDEVKKAMDFDLSSIVGCLITHEHGDHAGHIQEVVYAGIDVYSSKGTFQYLSNSSPYPPHRWNFVKHRDRVKIGGFSVIPMNVVHDANEPLAYIISHEESGAILFITDTHYIPFKIPNLSNIIIECNYSLRIANDNIANGASRFVRDRVLETHMELETVKEFLRVNDISELNNVVLAHLSDGNADSKLFKKEIGDITVGKQVWVAEKGLDIDFNVKPF